MYFMNLSALNPPQANHPNNKVAETSVSGNEAVRFLRTYQKKDVLDQVSQLSTWSLEIQRIWVDFICSLQ